MIKKSKKILFILHTPPPVHGSSIVGQYIQSSKIINGNFNCKYINLGTSKTINEIGNNGLIKLWRYFKIILKTLTQLIEFQPNICYIAITAKGPAFYKDAFLVLLIKLFRIKVVYHFHNKGVSKRQDKWLDNFLYQLVFRNSKVILLSEHLYPDIKKYVPKKQVHYCPNGIPEHAHIYKKDKNNSIVEILFLSNLIESKGVFVLLEALKILKNRNIKFHCTYIGSEGDVSKELFQQMVEKLSLSDAVHYVGRKYGAEKENFFANANIFSFPTYYDNECFPLVLIEAMQFSLPVISTFEGGIPDIVEDGKTSFLVPQKNTEALADKLEVLITNPQLRKKMGEAGRLKYEKEFTLDRFENRLNDILTQIVSNENGYR